MCTGLLSAQIYSGYNIYKKTPTLHNSVEKIHREHQVPHIRENKTNKRFVDLIVYEKMKLAPDGSKKKNFNIVFV